MNNDFLTKDNYLNICDKSIPFSLKLIEKGQPFYKTFQKKYQKLLDVYRWEDYNFGLKVGEPLFTQDLVCAGFHGSWRRNKQKQYNDCHGFLRGWNAGVWCWEDKETSIIWIYYCDAYFHSNKTDQTQEGHLEFYKKEISDNLTFDKNLSFTCGFTRYYKENLNFELKYDMINQIFESVIRFLTYLRK